jgi:hypothetical protein
MQPFYILPIDYQTNQCVDVRFVSPSHSISILVVEIYKNLGIQDAKNIGRLDTSNSHFL